MFLDDFDTEEKYTATFSSKSQTYTNGILGAEVWTPIVGGTASCIFWNDSMARSVVSEKYRETVDAVAVFNYADIDFTIPSESRVTINSKIFSVIIIDNIAEQNEVIQVLLKKYE